jgi:hypothetical protein
MINDEDEVGDAEMLTFRMQDPRLRCRERAIAKKEKEKITIICWLRATRISKAMSDPGASGRYIMTDRRTCFPLHETWVSSGEWLEQGKVGETYIK